MYFEEILQHFGIFLTGFRFPLVGDAGGFPDLWLNVIVVISFW
jgi:hypothetical protein